MLRATNFSATSISASARINVSFCARGVVGVVVEMVGLVASIVEKAHWVTLQATKFDATPNVVFLSQSDFYGFAAIGSVARNFFGVSPTKYSTCHAYLAARFSRQL